MGLGEIIGDKQKSFKRYNPDDEECPDKENVKIKWKKLNLD